MTEHTSVGERKRMVEPDHSGLSVLQQCILLGLARSSFYYKPVGESEFNLMIMRIMDEIHLDYPYCGVRRIMAELQRRGYGVGEKRVQRLMKLMGIEAMCPKPKTTIAAPEHKKYPYLLRGLDIVRPNQVWEMDITYIPMRHGFMYLAAIIDVFSRRIMGWGLSNTMEAEWCAEIAMDAFLRYGRPEIFNTDQGSQFTSEVFITTLVGEDFDNPKLKISMDGRGRATDDIYIERFWRSIKYEDIYLNAYEDGVELWHGIDNYIRIYNTKRLHQSLDYQTPDEVYKKVS